METVVFIILVLVVVSLVLKMSFSRAAGVAAGIVAGLFILASGDAAASQSKTQIAMWLSQPSLMLDAAVLLTVDVALQIAFCFMTARVMAGRLSKWGRVVATGALWVPGLLVFPALFTLLTQAVFIFTGADFMTTAVYVAVGVAVIIPLAAMGMSRLVPEPEIRLEMIFMINLLIAALGVIATVNGTTASAGTSDFDALALLAVAVILLSGALIGLLTYRKFNSKKISKLI